MTILHIEGFDHLDDNEAAEKHWGEVSISGFNVGSGRFGGQGAEIQSSTLASLTKYIGSNESTIYLGVAIKKAEAGTVTLDDSYPFMAFRDESSVVQVKLCVTANYAIAAYQGDDTLLGTTSDNIFQDLKWNYLEAKITISATVGEVTLRIGETQVLNLTSQDTKNGSDYINSVLFKAIHSSRTTYFDDMYIDDAEFHGDCRVRTFMPDSISTTNNSFTASAGNKDECVDEVKTNKDTDYIYSDTLNHKQGFGITTGTLGTVKGIQLNNHCRIDQAGTRKITSLIRSNGTDYSGTETDLISADWHFESEIFEDDPDDSNPWTQTKLEAAEFGLEITT